MRNYKQRRFGSRKKPPTQGTNAITQKEQTQQDYEAFREWIASGDASKPISADELQRMSLLASKIK